MENNNNNNYNDIDNNMLDDIVNNKQMKGDTQVFRGYYLDKDLADAIELNTKGKKKKGVKSDVVNAALRKTFREMGWIGNGISEAEKTEEMKTQELFNQLVNRIKSEIKEKEDKRHEE